MAAAAAIAAGVALVAERRRAVLHLGSPRHAASFFCVWGKIPPPKKKAPTSGQKTPFVVCGVR